MSLTVSITNVPAHREIEPICSSRLTLNQRTISSVGTQFLCLPSNQRMERRSNVGICISLLCR